MPLQPYIGTKGASMAQRALQETTLASSPRTASRQEQSLKRSFGCWDQQRLHKTTLENDFVQRLSTLYWHRGPLNDSCAYNPALAQRTLHWYNGPYRRQRLFSHLALLSKDMHQTTLEDNKLPYQTTTPQSSQPTMAQRAFE